MSSSSMTPPPPLRLHPMNENYKFLQISTVIDPNNNDSNDSNDNNNNHNHPAAGTVWVVSLHRPRKRNALNRRMWKEIGQLFSRLGSTSDGCPCRCVLLTGSGASFCAGIDFADPSFLPNNNTSSDQQTDVARTGIAFASKLHDMQQAFTALEQCPVPVLAAIHGHCVGAGVDLATAAQIRWCTANAQFSVKEVALGLAADVGTLQRLPKAVGNQSWVQDVCCTGRSFGAQEALQVVLVSKILPTPEMLFQEALQLCLQIARHSPLAVHGTKRALLYSRDHSVSEGLEQISAFNQLALQAPDIRQAILAGATKQKEAISFEDLPSRSRL